MATFSFRYMTEDGISRGEVVAKNVDALSHEIREFLKKNGGSHILDSVNEQVWQHVHPDRLSEDLFEARPKPVELKLASSRLPQLTEA